MSWVIVCESAELAVQCLHATQALELDMQPLFESDWLSSARAQLLASRACAVVLLHAPSLATLADLAGIAHGKPAPLALAVIAPDNERSLLLDAAGDLGVVALTEIKPLLAALTLLDNGGRDAFSASGRGLSATDRARLKPTLLPNPKNAGQLLSIDGARIGYTPDPAVAAVSVGEPRDVAEALAALRATVRSSQAISPSVDGVDARVVLDVIFGPRRALSDPASKAALAPYGIPLPMEELCSSPSRAASEASRIGYPVRISLASPDLRVWDHPDLSVDMVDNAARVRDTFHQLVALAHDRVGNDPAARAASENRLLGVMVTATSDALALLGVHATPLPKGRVAMQVGFADAHGRASGDRTIAVLPASPETIERSLRRLRGADLLFDASVAQRKARLEAISDVLLRLAAFVHEQREHIDWVEIRPLAVLLDGSVEAREACVSVNDSFERSLGMPPTAAAGR